MIITFFSKFQQLKKTDGVYKRYFIYKLSWVRDLNEDSECKQPTTRAKKNMRKVRSYAQRLYIKQILIIFFSYKALEKCIFFPFKKLNLTIHTPKQSKELSKTQGWTKESWRQKKSTIYTTFQCTKLTKQSHGTNQESQHHLNLGHNIVQHHIYDMGKLIS